MPRVLIVDDDPFMCQLMRRMAVKLACDAIDVQNGIDAEAKTIEFQPDLILLDIMMPDQDGYDTCRHLRAAGFTGLIVMVSALQVEKHLLISRDAGADGYVQKPLTNSVLEGYLSRISIRQ